MKRWITEIQAIDPINGILKKWAGPEIMAPDRQTAQIFLDQQGLGYCRLVGELLLEIDREGKTLPSISICPN